MEGSDRSARLDGYSMKGLALSRRYFAEVVLPAIERQVPECLPHLAAGRCGGSETYGNDDEVSRDHAWGVGCSTWLVGDAHLRFADPLREMAERLPREFLGYPAGCGVSDLDESVRCKVGCVAAPETAMDWLHIPESYLFEVAHAAIFHDATGEATRRFRAFAHYPEDAWRYRLQVRLNEMLVWGIKYHRRAERQGDMVTATIHWTQFAIAAMRVGFSLNRRHSPYHKWLWREFCKLPDPSARVVPLLDEGFARTGDRVALANQIMDVYKEELGKRGIIPVPLTPERRARLAYMDAEELLPYIAAVRQSIEDEQIREASGLREVLPPAWMEVSTPLDPQ